MELHWGPKMVTKWSQNGPVILEFVKAVQAQSSSKQAVQYAKACSDDGLCPCQWRYVCARDLPYCNYCPGSL